MIEQRLTVRLTAMWKQLASGELPAFARFNPTRVQDLWENCVVVVPLPRAEQAALQLQLEHVGAQVGQLLGSEMIGRKIVGRATGLGGVAILKKIEAVVEDPSPTEDSGQFVNDRSKVVKYRACFLPFGGGDAGVTHVLVGLSWREF